MTVTEQFRRAGPAVSSGAVASYAFPFKTARSSEVAVFRSETDCAIAPDVLLEEGIDYEVTLNADQDSNPGGTVTLLNALPEGIRVSVLSKVPFTQETAQTVFSAKVTNAEFDKLTKLVQQLAECQSRAVLLPATSLLDPREWGRAIIEAKEICEAAAKKAQKAADAAEESSDAAVKAAEQAKADAARAEGYAKVCEKLLPYLDALKNLSGISDELADILKYLDDIRAVAGACEVEAWENRRDYGWVNDTSEETCRTNCADAHECCCCEPDCDDEDCGWVSQSEEASQRDHIISDRDYGWTHESCLKRRVVGGPLWLVAHHICDIHKLAGVAGDLQKLIDSLDAIEKANGIDADKIAADADRAEAAADDAEEWARKAKQSADDAAGSEANSKQYMNAAYAAAGEAENSADKAESCAERACECARRSCASAQLSGEYADKAKASEERIEHITRTVQSDWADEDEGSAAYIRNKPALEAYVKGEALVLNIG